MLSASVTPTICPAGSYAPQGSSSPTLAPVGYYSPSSGASAPTICAAGYYTSNTGMTSETPASPGYYVPTSGSSTETICPAGFYAPFSATTTPIQCPAGHYAPQGSSAPILCQAGTYAGPGASAPTSCAAGYYAPNSGMSSETPASPGYYVPNAGSSTETICPGGFYAPGSATITPIQCAAGSYAPQGSSSPILCQAGYYAGAGASTQTPSPSGDYVPTTGASSPTVDPAGTWSHIASVAARSASPTAPRDPVNHIVGPIYTATPSPTIDLTSGPASLTVSNASTDLGIQDSLTGLSLLSATLSGGDSADFQITGFTAGTLLYEKGVTNIHLSVINPSSLAPGTHSTTLTVQTDQTAPFGSPGDAFTYTVTLTVPAPPSLAISFADPNDVVITWSAAGYNLQSASGAAGTYATIPGATSPYTNSISAGSQFFRLIHQ